MKTNEYELLKNAIAHEHELRQQKELEVEKARQIQFDEYERRLESLNHAHEQAVEAQRLTVPRETFDKYVETSKTALDAALKNVNDASDRRATEVDRRLAGLEKSDDRGGGKAEGSAATVRWAVFALGALGTILTIAVIIANLVPKSPV